MGLPEESIYYLALIGGFVLLFYGHKVIYPALGGGALITTVSVASMLCGPIESIKEPYFIAAAVGTGLVAGWRIIAWYRRQLLAVCTVLGAGGGALVAFAFLSVLKIAMDKLGGDDVEAIYHKTPVKLKYPSFADGYACFQGSEKNCKAHRRSNPNPHPKLPKPNPTLSSLTLTPTAVGRRSPLRIVSMCSP